MSIVIEGQTIEGTLRAEVGVARLDAASSRDFKKEIDSLWDDSVRAVEFDFSKVDFIDSRAVGGLIRAWKTVVARGGKMYLSNASPAVREIIALLRLDKVLADWNGGDPK